MKSFQPNQPANEVHTAIKTALQTLEKAEQNALLWFGEILHRKLYIELGYSSIKQYALQDLGFSETRFYDFKNLCEKLKDLPKVKAKVESGQLGYSTALVLVKVADKKNEGAWLGVAKEKSRRGLENEVKLARKKAADEAAGQIPLMPIAESCPVAVVPVSVNMKMSPTQFARYELLWEQIRKQGSISGDKVEAMLEIMAAFATGNSHRWESQPQVKPPVQLHIHQCPDCEKNTVQTSRGELEIGQAELDMAEDDCQISRHGERNTTAIAPATRRFVLARARHQCERAGCSHSHFLEIHHKIQRSKGGTNDPENLTVLCSGCHRLLHEHKTGKSYSFVKAVQAIYRWNAVDGDNPDRAAYCQSEVIYQRPHKGENQDSTSSSLNLANKKARANCQSRSTVGSEIFNAAAVSAIVRPVKNRSNTTLTLRSSTALSSSNASSKARKSMLN